MKNIVYKIPPGGAKPLGHDVKSCEDPNNSTYWADNPSIGHISIHIQDKNFEFFTLLMSPVLFICILVGTETISSDEGSIDISDIFSLLSAVKKMWKYPSDIRVSENCIDPKS